MGNNNGAVSNNGPEGINGAGSLQRYLSPLGVWALAFGCSVGWGAFVMPGTTFLPIAGPVGTTIGLVIGGVIMLIIGVNYHYMINQYPDAGGAYTYTKKALGYDHGFLCAWFLMLVYVAILWANATALPLIMRNLLGSAFQFGPDYELAGFHIYMGEVALAITSIVLFGLVCLRNNLAKWVQIVMALVLLGGIIVCFAGTWAGHQGGMSTLKPSYAPGTVPAGGIMNIIFLAPWAFVGFESISHSASEFSFSHKKSGLIMIIAVIAASAAYIMLSLNAVAMLPPEYGSWPEYLADLGNAEGIKALPTFYATETAMGSSGAVLLGITAMGGIITGLIGNYIAASRLIWSMAEDGLFPRKLADISRNSIPRNAIFSIMLVSVIIPFFGRTATSWIIDVTTVGAAIAYAYTSAATLKTARQNGEKKAIYFGAAGIAVSALIILYFLVPNMLEVSTLSTESYLILAAWSIVGFAVFRSIFKRDTERRFGRSTIVWMVLLGLVYFTSTIWTRQSTQRAAGKAIEPIHEHYVNILKEEGVDVTTSASKNSMEYLHGILDDVSDSMTTNLLVQTGLIIIALAIIFSIYSIMQRREKQIEVEKALAEEVSRAKTSFLSNMSHEIRTPMNAIIGLDNIALRDQNLSPHTRDQLEKIGSSARHLLGLINDILDMSRIESGRMVLKNEDFAMRGFLDQINVIINGQCVDKGLEFECGIIGSIDDYYVGDDMKLKQVLINILGNSVKFTPAPGKVSFLVQQTGRTDGRCTLRFTMRDTGIGMDKEYIPKIFEAFSQEDATTTNKYGGSGLGMAITGNLVEMMGGRIDVESEKGVGSTFTVSVSLGESEMKSHDTQLDGMLPMLRVAVVDDDEVACEHAQLVLDELGIHPDVFSRSPEAYSWIHKRWEAGEAYDLIISDYRMPVMDGVTLTEEIRRFDEGRTGVIILTGYDFDDVAERAHREGVDGILTKPLFADTLLHEIQTVMKSRIETAEPDGADAAGADSGDEGYGLEGIRVLVAEDVEINAEILMDLLEIEEIESERAANGEIAADMFADSEEGYYDAVLMDIRMPVMDGLTSAAAIRAMERADAKTVPIIALTANAFDEDVQNSLDAGMNAHLSKPVEPDKLYKTLSELIHADGKRKTNQRDT